MRTGGRNGVTVALVAASVSFAPLAAAHACSRNGKLANLMPYAGQSALNGTTLDNDPAILARLKRLPESVEAHLHRNLGVQGYVDLVSCHLVLKGNAEHQGGIEDAIVDVNLYSGAVTAGLYSADHTTIYLDADPTAASSYDGSVPLAVRSWASNAASGFRLLEQLPSNAEIVKPGE